MGKLIKRLTQSNIEFIQNQHMFFVATADEAGKVNVSPKGLDSLYVANPDTIYWLNLTGSGNETAAHTLAHNRMTLMFCSFEGPPLILRTYGTAKIIRLEDIEDNTARAKFAIVKGTRQIFRHNIEAVQSSCGFGVPLYNFVGQRSELTNWIGKKGEAGLKEYQKLKNALSLDGKPTDINSYQHEV